MSPLFLHFLTLIIFYILLVVAAQDHPDSLDATISNTGLPGGDERNMVPNRNDEISSKPKPKPPRRKPISKAREVVRGTSARGAPLIEGECRMKSSANCRATQCYAAGGRCAFAGPKRFCKPHILNSAGTLTAWNWNGDGGPSECVGGCSCQRFVSRARKAGSL